MPDLIDQAQESEQKTREHCLRERVYQRKAMTAVGECYNCAAWVPIDACFCDDGCRDDYELRKKMERIGGAA